MTKGKKDEKDEAIEYAVELMDGVVEDTGVPRNIRKSVDDAKQKVLDESEPKNVRVTTAIYILDDVSKDINIPAHTRTEICQIISDLEAIREKAK